LRLQVIVELNPVGLGQVLNLLRTSPGLADGLPDVMKLLLSILKFLQLLSKVDLLELLQLLLGLGGQLSQVQRLGLLLLLLAREESLHLGLKVGLVGSCGLSRGSSLNSSLGSGLLSGLLDWLLRSLNNSLLLGSNLQGRCLDLLLNGLDRLNWLSRLC